MKTFIDSATNEYWEFEDDVKVSQLESTYNFHTSYGLKINTPDTLVPGTRPAPKTPTLDEVKRIKLAELNQKAQAEVQVHLSGYPDFEIQTWYIQQGEAVAYSKDSEAPTPFCDTASAARGISKEEFISKVLVKVEQFKQLSAIVAGYRQSLEDQMNAITSNTAANRTKVSNITWVSPLQA